jgi:hypothetical protein|tara:strand:+ start:144 stop:1280 length:1137 start_codon:yes stop_codon:yes gene_type:complete
MAETFPDLNKDGKVTQADVLMGRGVDLDRDDKAEGSMLVPPERQKRSIGSLIGRLATKAVITPELQSKATKAGKAFNEAGKDDFLDRAVDKIEANEKILKEDFGVTNNQLKVIAYHAGDVVEYADVSEDVIKGITMEGTNAPILDAMTPMKFERFEKIHGSKFKDEDDLVKFYLEYLNLFEPDKTGELRAKLQKGGEPPVDTYDNISPEEKAQNDATMLDDGEMEEEYVDYVAEQVLEPEEQDYLFKVLDADPKLEGILDKVMLSASEFAGSGEVEGPGTGISDSIPARLSDGEFVITKKATDQIGADNLQTMMDDAERAADGSLMGMANGGQAGTNPFVNPEETSNPLNRFEMDKDDERDIERQMLYSSRMPSLMNR